MKRLLTTLVILVLVGFAAFKAGVWWLADQRMADARQALEESGVLHRGSISSGVEGRVVLNRASWQDFELT
ncbi:MAG: acetylornithine deacetylase, partial [Marinobacter sp.]|nr:acetylornithine deacetylase [Marinobacter sp.]